MRRSGLEGRAPRALVLLALTSLALAPSLAAAPAAGAKTGLPPVRHVFVIVLENKGFDKTFGANSPAPYLSLTLPSMGAFLPDYFGVTHESLGNYVALVSGQGSNPQTQLDCQFYTPFSAVGTGSHGQALGSGCVYPSSVKTIADQLSARRLSWRGYMEDMGNAAGQPHTCRHPTLGAQDKTQSARAGDQYAARHNPFVYFDSLLASGACGRDDVPLTQLPGDLASASRTANYSFITPNLCNDGHDASCASGGPGGLPGINRFLRSWVPRILASRAYRRDGLLAVVFDESDGSDASACCGELQFPNTPNNGGPDSGLGGGRTGAVLLSPFIDPGTVVNVSYNHFSLLRSVEDLFGLSHLGYAALSAARPLGTEAFTCYRPGRVRARHGRLPRGSEVKLAVIGQGTARRPMLEVKLWHPGGVSVSVRSGARHARLHRVGRPRRAGACQLVDFKLPYTQGTAVLKARAFGGVESRTVAFP